MLVYMWNEIILPLYVCLQIHETFIESNCCMSNAGLKICHQLHVLWRCSGARPVDSGQVAYH